MAKKRKSAPGVIQNRRARFDYELGDSVTAGIVLSGAETKSLRMGHGHLRGSYVTVKDNELWLINGTIAGTNGIPISEQDQTRSRKLLVSKRERDALITAKQQGNHLIPTDILTKGRYIKVKLAVSKSKKRFDKRDAIKKREQDIEMGREFKR